MRELPPGRGGRARCNARSKCRGVQGTSRSCGGGGEARRGWGGKDVQRRRTGGKGPRARADGYLYLRDPGAGSGSGRVGKYWGAADSRVDTLDAYAERGAPSGRTRCSEGDNGAGTRSLETWPWGSEADRVAVSLCRAGLGSGGSTHPHVHAQPCSLRSASRSSLDSARWAWRASRTALPCHEQQGRGEAQAERARRMAAGSGEKGRRTRVQCGRLACSHGRRCKKRRRSKLNRAYS